MSAPGYLGDWSGGGTVSDPGLCNGTVVGVSVGSIEVGGGGVGDGGVGALVGVTGVVVTGVGGSGPGPSGSTKVVGAGALGSDGSVGVVSVDSVVVVVVGVVVVVLGCVRTLVRGTQVYAGSGMNPGGTTAVSGAFTAAGGW